MKKKNNITTPRNESERLIYALDIGTSKLRMAAGYVDSSKQIKLKGYLERPRVGIAQGCISDMQQVANNIALIVQDFQNKFNCVVKDVVTEVPGWLIQAENQQGTYTVASGTVTINDRNQAIKNAIAGVKFNTTDYDIIHAHPKKYQTESAERIENPIGIYARRLDVNVHVIGCNYMYKKNVDKAICMTSPNIRVNSVVYVGNAASAAVLSSGERDIGVVQIDLGDSTSSVTVFEGDSQLISFGINGGGSYITRNIAKEFSLPIEDAENLKIHCGVASPDYLNPQDLVSPITIQGNAQNGDSKEIQYGALAYVIQQSLIMMFDRFLERINTIGKQSYKSLEIGGGFVLTGGLANLPGIDRVLIERIELFKQNPAYDFLTCTPKVRLGVPSGVAIFEDACDPKVIANPDKAVVIGLMRAACFDTLHEYTGQSVTASEEPRTMWAKFVDWYNREVK